MAVLAERGRGGCLGWSVYGEAWHAGVVLDVLLEWLSLASDLAAHSLCHHSSPASHLSSCLGSPRSVRGLLERAVASSCNAEPLRPVKAR